MTCVSSTSLFTFFQLLGHISYFSKLKYKKFMACPPISQAWFKYIMKYEGPFWSLYWVCVTSILGVSMASLTELSFNWTGFISAMISNIAFTYRSIYSKKAMVRLPMMPDPCSDHLCELQLRFQAQVFCLYFYFLPQYTEADFITSCNVLVSKMSYAYPLFRI